MPYAVGLTGGIGSGKSTVAGLFAKLGATCIDTDAIARALTAPGGIAIAAIENKFGPDFIGADGSLDRATARQRVFSDPKAKRALEEILHPLIRRDVDARLLASRAAYVIVDVPLLIETGAYRDRVQRVVVVDCDEQLQIDRTAARSNLNRSEVEAIMSTQATRAERLQHADDIILNESGIEALVSSVEVVDQRLRALAKLACVEKRD